MRRYAARLVQKDMPRIYAQNRIRELRTLKGMSLEALGLALDPPVSHSTIAKLESRAMALSLDYIQQIAEVLEVSPAELIGDQIAGVRYAPLVGTIAAGQWEQAVMESTDFLPVPLRAGGPRAFALRICGDSIDQVVPDGGYALIDPDQLDLIPGKIFAVMNGDHETTVKKYVASPPSLVPMSNNPQHKPILIGRSPFVVIGRVVFVLNET